ncbi:MAG: glycerol-3-phosphate 1-O-acyltransferase PlsY [Candidatus Eremiobacteraeota bacterium]|nr:glycerol-3-phosphate 1-O-acyltransferase PlsY [Candidatus Eremiobacteraeota bacterium]
MFWIFILVIIGYLSGSVPYGIVIGKKFKGIDIRKTGSGNIGTANAVRALGPFLGGMVFLCDSIKGAIPILLTLGINKWFPGAIPQNLVNLTITLVGFASILGHNYPLFLGFKGGKGIATSFGVFVILDWRAAILSLLVWVIIVTTTKLSSLGSLMGSISLPILMIVFKSPKEFIIFGFIASAFAFYKHRANIGRLLKGEEKKIVRNRKSDDGDKMADDGDRKSEAGGQKSDNG